MPDFKNSVDEAMRKIDDAKYRAFAARLDAIGAILEGADASDVMLLCVYALAGIVPAGCPDCMVAFEAVLLARLRDCVKSAEHEDDDDGTNGGQVH